MLITVFNWIDILTNFTRVMRFRRMKDKLYYNGEKKTLVILVERAERNRERPNLNAIIRAGLSFVC